MGRLDDILTEKTREVAALRGLPAPRRADGVAPRDVRAALARPAGAPLKLIAEIKFRSPSAGPLSRALPAGQRARAYEAGGASMVSVLTDGRWFEGSFDDLRAARAGTGLPVLCKDFVIDPVQVEHAWAAGADAVLVIVRCLHEDEALKRIVESARAKGIEPFVEVMDERELERALQAEARVIGVNARDLDTLAMDATRAARVLGSIPRDCVAVRLSGVKSGSDAAAIAASRADAALIGEALMRTDTPETLMAELARGAAARAV
jgi:indole-3-glycerol phosphate synthase